MKTMSHDDGRMLPLTAVPSTVLIETPKILHVLGKSKPFREADDCIT